MEPIHTHHISRQYNTELEEIRSRVLQMGGLVEQQIDQALTALEKADTSLGEAVIMDDTKVNQLDVTIDEECQHKYHYSTHGRPITWDDGVGDYIAFAGPSSAPSGWQEGVQGFQNPEIVHEFAWGLSEIITALLDAGLVLEHFREFDHAAHKLYSRSHHRDWVSTGICYTSGED